MESFVFLTDLHWGYERRGGHKVATHDLRALSVAQQFMQDFKPDHVILGGDILDCGAISHHNKTAGSVEGLKLFEDAKQCREMVIEPIEKLKPKSLTYITGNHEDWLNDLVDLHPGLEGIIDLKSILKLSDKWKIIPCGEAHKLGKLVFLHGDQIKGGEYPAKWATTVYERSVRFGHFHTFQSYSKTSAIEDNGHTGVAVPCLCKKGPKYGGGSPNRWMQGFQWGFIGAGGVFNDYTTIITDGKAMIGGKEYRG